MAATYDYQTRKVTRDFKFVEYGTKCRLSGLPTYAGYSSSERCSKCPYNGGTFSASSCGVEFWGRFKEWYVMCKHPDAVETENEEIGMVRWAFNEKLEHNALCALCY